MTARVQLQVGDGPTSENDQRMHGRRESVGSPELRLLKLTVTCGIGKDTHTRFRESKPKRN